MKPRRATPLVPVLMALLVPAGSAEAAPQETLQLPTRPGTILIYRGLTKWTIPNSNRTREQVVTWECEIVDSMTTAGLEGVLWRGYPTELAWYEEGKTRGLHLVLRQANRYSHTGGDQAWPCFEAIRGGEQPPRTCSPAVGVFLDLPLTIGKVFGGDKPYERTDQLYAWVVEKIDSIATRTIRGAPTARTTRYRLSYRTNPDHEIFELAEGIGIVRYVYAHHGTVAETDLRLIEFRQPR